MLPSFIFLATNTITFEIFDLLGCCATSSG